MVHARLSANNPLPQLIRNHGLRGAKRAATPFSSTYPQTPKGLHLRRATVWRPTTFRSGPTARGHAAVHLVREWRRRIGRYGGYPSKEIPISSTHSRRPTTASRPTSDADGRQLRLEYTTPPGVDPERAAEVIVTAVLATHDAPEWAREGLDGIDTTPGVTGSLGHQELQRWSPFQTVKKSVHRRQPVDEQEAPDE